MAAEPKLRLLVLDNHPKHAANFPHEVRDGVYVQAKTVNTVVRVGLQVQQPFSALAEPMKAVMTLHGTSGEITSCLAAAKPLYQGHTSTTQELRSYGDVPEATFAFKFNITPEKDVPGGTKDTKLWLRFSLEGMPHVYVDTPHFRLVAKKEKAGPGGPPAPADLLRGAEKLADDLTSVLNAATDPADRETLRECSETMGQLLAKVRQLSVTRDADQARAEPIAVGAEPVTAMAETDGLSQALAAARQPSRTESMSSVSSEPSWVSEEVLDSFIEEIGGEEADELRTVLQGTPPAKRRCRVDAPQDRNYRSLGDTSEEEVACSFRSLGDEEGHDAPRPAGGLMCAALARRVMAPQRALERLPMSARASAMTKLRAIAREMCARRSGGAAVAAAAARELGEEIEDVKQFIRFHLGFSSP